MDIKNIVQSARVVTDESDQPAVLLPLAMWQNLLAQIEAQSLEHERIKAILKRWEAEPEDKSAEWWDSFEAELKANRATLTTRGDRAKFEAALSKVADVEPDKADRLD